MTRIDLPQTDSTNSWLRANAADLPHGAIVVARTQTAGRGQRGNSWESAPGMNVTCSILLRPKGIPPSGQFFISEAVALAVTDLLASYLSPTIHPSRIRVKWPNDIYVDNHKIAGILIEHSIVSATEIGYTIAGIGLNVNQTQWHSDAPNPTSMASLTGRTFRVDTIANELQSNVVDLLQTDATQLHRRYMDSLWRCDGALHPFALPDGIRFSAAIDSVAADGMLTLVTVDGTRRTFAFKEVSFVL